MQQSENRQLLPTENGQLLAVSSIMIQPWVEPTEAALALRQGTLFENLHFPFYAGGTPE